MIGVYRKQPRAGDRFPHQGRDLSPDLTIIYQETDL